MLCGGGIGLGFEGGRPQVLTIGPCNPGGIARDSLLFACRTVCLPVGREAKLGRMPRLRAFVPWLRAWLQLSLGCFPKLPERALELDLLILEGTLMGLEGTLMGR
jgi:hypothetical protein